MGRSRPGRGDASWVDQGREGGMRHGARSQGPVGGTRHGATKFRNGTKVRKGTTKAQWGGCAMGRPRPGRGDAPCGDQGQVGRMRFRGFGSGGG